ncbi:hypothetical protein [Cellulomonas xylanilytica]|uniref:Uncharacterized protein n=1 Tax=Cellulomonas xylanilytica TaxID=233583 RepID=A0A510V6J4_9CELL|nr:hypothetical protein [Cellulomonas xylanilytica]GEK22469.1 hypothetical protein CXY01_29890 [Cellulomonas xylanilytica]
MSHSDPTPHQPDTSDAGSSMPVAPQYRAEPVAAAASVERPSSVTRAVQLMYVGAALSVVGIIVAWTTRSELREQVAAMTPSLDADGVESAVTISLMFATVIGVIGVGLWLWMAAANGAGKSWARVVATVLGGLGVLSAVFSLMSGTGITIASQLLSLVLAVAILVLLWRPASSAYFQARSARQV